MEVKNGIEEKNVVWNKAYNQGDAAVCVAVFAEDAIMLPPNQPMACGKKALKER